MGRLTAHGDPQMFPFRTLKIEGAMYTQLVGKLMFAIVASSLLCCSPLILLSVRRLALSPLPSHRTRFPMTRRQTEENHPRCVSAACLQSHTRRGWRRWRWGVKAGWIFKESFSAVYRALESWMWRSELEETAKWLLSHPHWGVLSWNLALLSRSTPPSLPASVSSFQHIDV